MNLFNSPFNYYLAHTNYCNILTHTPIYYWPLALHACGPSTYFYFKPKYFAIYIYIMGKFKSNAAEKEKSLDKLSLLRNSN